MTPRYFTDDEINRMRSGLFAMGQENNASMEILDGYTHMRSCLDAIEKMVEGLNKPRKLEDQLADEVCLAGGDTAKTDSRDFIVQVKKRLRDNMSSVLHDISEMARAGAEMEDWTKVVAHA